MTDDRSLFFSRRRAQTLAALGLPLLSCGPAATDRTGDDAVVIEPINTASPDPGPPPVVDPGGSSSLRCGPDQLREVACTEKKGDPCRETLDSRADKYISRIEIFASQQFLTFDQGLSDDLTAKEPARPKCCFARCTPLKVAASAEMPVASSQDEGIRPRCISMPDAPSSFPAPNAPKCPAAVTLPNTIKLAPFAQTQSSTDDPAHRPPSWIAERCCYHVRTSLLGVGRPYRIDGSRTLPRASVIDALGDADPRVVEHWHAVARGEHASVFAFAALARALEHVGAPRELVDLAHRARRDEVAHAKLAYAWLERLTGERVVPGALELAWSPKTLGDLAIEAMRDGCFEEGLGAAIAHHLSGVAESPELRGMLTRVAVEEAEHAELAWRIVAFVLEKDPSLAAELARELEAIDASIEELQGAPDDTLEHAGVPAASTVRALARDVVRDWVRPCLGALMLKSAA